METKADRMDGAATPARRRGRDHGGPGPALMGAQTLIGNADRRWAEAMHGYSGARPYRD